MAKIIERGRVVVELDQDEFDDLVKLLGEMSPGDIRRHLGESYNIQDGSLERLYLALRSVQEAGDGRN